MKSKVMKKRFWAAVLSIVAILGLALSGVETPKMRSVYAASPGDSIAVHDGSTTIEVGKTVTLQVANTGGEAWSQVDDNGKEITWTQRSSDGGTVEIEYSSPQNQKTPKIAYIKGEKPGKVIISVNQGDYRNAEIEITVKSASTSTPTLSIKEGTGTKIAVGKKFALNAVLTPEVTNATFAWESSDPDIASVSKSGKTATVTAIEAGTVEITATATIPNANGTTSTVQRSFAVTVSDDILILNDELPDAYVNKEYKEIMIATSATNDTYTWSVTGSLPAGLQLNQKTGVISGIPTTAGTYRFTIRVTNKNGDASDAKEYTITVSGDMLVVTAETYDDEVFPTEPNESYLEQIRQNLARSYRINDLRLYFPVEVMNPSDNSISGKSKIDAAVKSISSKVSVHYVDVTPTYTGTNSLTGQRMEGTLQDTIAPVELTFDIRTGDSYCVVMRYHNGVLQPLTKLSQRLSNNYVDGTYYYDRNARVYVYSRYFSTFAIVTSAQDIISVQFQSNGGSAVDPLVIERGTNITKPTDPTRSGYKFDGWYLDSNLQTKWENSTSLTNDNTVLYAKWTDSNASTTSGSSSSRGATNTSANSAGAGGTADGLRGVNSPQTSDPIDYIRAFAAMIVVCAGLIVVLGLFKKKARK